MLDGDLPGHSTPEDMGLSITWELRNIIRHCSSVLESKTLKSFSIPLLITLTSFLPLKLIIHLKSSFYKIHVTYPSLHEFKTCSSQLDYY